MCNALKQEEDALAVGGKLAVGRTNNTFAFEEKMINRDLKFSTNKIKREKEMSNLKTGKEGLRMGVFESGTLKEGSEEREEGKILKVGLDLSNSEETVDGQALQRSLDEIRKEKCDISGELTNLKSINLKRGELKKEIEELKDLTIEVVKAKKGEVSQKIKLGAVAVEALIDPGRQWVFTKYRPPKKKQISTKCDQILTTKTRNINQTAEMVLFWSFFYTKVLFF